MEREEFTAAFEESKDRLFGFLLRLTGNRQEAEELFQEAALKAWRGRAGFQGGSRFSTWLHAIALNAWRNRRRVASRDVPFDPAIAEGLADPAPGPEQAAAGREAGQRLARALERMTEAHRLPLLLRYGEDLPYREVARVMGISEEDARTRTYRARHALMCLMEEELP